MKKLSILAIVVALVALPVLAITERANILWTGSISDSVNTGKEFATIDDGIAALRDVFLAEVTEYPGYEWQVKVFRLSGSPTVTYTWSAHRKVFVLDGQGFDSAASAVKAAYATHSAANPPSVPSYYQIQLVATAPH